MELFIVREPVRVALPREPNSQGLKWAVGIYLVGKVRKDLPITTGLFAANGAPEHVALDQLDGVRKCIRLQRAVHVVTLKEPHDQDGGNVHQVAQTFEGHPQLFGCGSTEAKGGVKTREAEDVLEKLVEASRFRSDGSEFSTERDIDLVSLLLLRRMRPKCEVVPHKGIEGSLGATEDAFDLAPVGFI